MDDIARLSARQIAASRGRAGAGLLGRLTQAQIAAGQLESGARAAGSGG